MTEAAHATGYDSTRALLRKDWRSYRAPVIALIIIGFAVYALGITVYLRSTVRQTFAYALADTSMLAIAFSTLIAPALAGMSLAGERADRTALFTAMLPARRTQIAASKLALCLAIMVAALSLHLVVAGTSMLVQWSALQQAALPSQRVPEWTAMLSLYAQPVSIFAAAAFTMFCVAWLVGSFSKSAVISACTGIAVTFGAFVLIAAFASEDEYRELAKKYLADRPWMLPVLISALVGVPSLLAGTVIYIRRTEP